MLFKKSEKYRRITSLGKIKRRAIGMDISQTAVRMVLLGADKLGQIQLENYAIQHLPQDIVTENEIIDFNQLLIYTQACWQQLNTPIKSIAFALPAARVTIDEFYFNPNNEQLISLPQFVANKISRLGNLDNIYYDWQVLSNHIHAMQQTILTAAVPMHIVLQYRQLLDELSLQASIATVDVFALGNAYTFAQRHVHFAKRTAIFHIHDNSILTIVIENGRTIYHHHSHFGFTTVLNNISQHYQINYNEACSIINQLAERPTDFQQQIIEPFAWQLSQEILRVIQFFAASQSQPNSQIERIILSGHSLFNTSLFTQIITQHTNIATEFSTALSNPSCLKIATHHENLTQNTPYLDVAFGLALQGVS